MVSEKLVVGTRGSKLALWQANYVAEAIRRRHPTMEVIIKHIVTTGDRILDVPLAKIGGKGLFTKELEKELLTGEIDLAVHSLKDMPTELPPGLTLGAITERLDAGDALISPRYKTIDQLPPGARVGTSSLRRKAQLLAYRPDLCITDLRGNLDTRLAKLLGQELDAILLAVAGLKRLGWEERITQILPQEICLPAVGQGALAIETRADDAALLEVLTFLHHEETAAAVTAERAYLNELEGGCQVPIGVYGRIEAGRLRLDAVILSADGRKSLRDSTAGEPVEAAVLGRELAQRMFAAGGREILAELTTACDKEEKL
ncbi:MAG: hydroxymethylbilane synthase [Negativicutes bacterium]|nr:hydroxymethylbilane synthase [Negativicutes bacterium]